ncbi:unnamed protein product [Eruca vesicaria subsp. sativa]|uniref:Pentatricopeptide repeat-containing protein n=1 Tax=Eruca vesicaria subsp. sativa TaxID=29727 RepID=A0ABC8KP26_ERUVS|nr:unnamed protein product [Eruca vesicaria subsp. sativa]
MQVRKPRETVCVDPWQRRDNGFISNLQLNNSLMNLYARHGDLIRARNLFDRMPKRDVGSWTAMISGYSRSGYHLSALLLFKQMRGEPVRANDFTYGSVLKSCKDLGCLKEGMQIWLCGEREICRELSFEECIAFSLC